MLECLGNQAAAAILATNTSGSNALKIACVSNSKAVATLLQYLGDQAAVAILATDTRGNNAFSVAVVSSVLIESFVTRLSPEQVHNGILTKNKANRNALEMVCNILQFLYMNDLTRESDKDASDMHLIDDSFFTKKWL